MKQRTAAERVNNRILNNYGIQLASTRGKKRIEFMATLAAINVHLDAQLKHHEENNPLNIYELLNIDTMQPAA